MAKTKGKQFWEMAARVGRPRLYNTPEELWKDCLEYFEWIEANPILTEKSQFANGKWETHDEEHPRAMTISGMACFMGIDEETWRNYAKREEFLGITTRVGALIFNQKFQGAAAGTMKENIIARETGLAERQEVKAVAKISADPLTPEEWAEMYGAKENGA